MSAASLLRPFAAAALAAATVAGVTGVRAAEPRHPAPAAGETVGIPSADAGEPIPDATSLVERLRDGREPVQLHRLQLDRGCGPRGCTIEVGELLITQLDRGLKSDGGARIALREHPHLGAAPPQADWAPITAHEIVQRGRRWGYCLLLSHTGIGRSGRAQRFSSIVVVPWPSGGRPRLADRFVGYWANCEALVSGDSADAVVVPLVQGNPAGGLRWVEWRCDGRGCKPQAATVPRHLAVDSQGIGGALRLLP